MAKDLLWRLGEQYEGSPLEPDACDADPIVEVRRWMQAAVDGGISTPNAVTLATVDDRGRPAARIVLLKEIDERGFVFYTNYESRKGGELAANPRAALMFHWEILGRVVRLEGPVQRTTREKSAAYAHTRPRGSQLSALASPQSRPIPSREWLEERAGELAERHRDQVPLGENWGGYRLTPERFEFWQHRTSRMHDRLLYTPAPDGGWRIERLAP